MLIWVCALHCEAKPVIDRYRLKKSPRDNAFDLFLGDGMACVISGSGKVASAAACAWAAERCGDGGPLAWINLGTAGAAQHELGAAFALHQVIDADDGRRFYPAPASDEEFDGATCTTLSRPGEDYREDCLFDMEASGFMYASLRFSSAELVKSVKIVSDNRVERVGRDRQRVSDLVYRHIERIDRQARALGALGEELGEPLPAAAAWRRLTGMAHFSRTQENRLRVLWRYLIGRQHDADRLLNQLDGHSAAAIIDDLERIRYRDSAGL